ncbi:MAG: hypothetical protein U0807_00490 [Candidatus Binatia bacterium]
MDVDELTTLSARELLHYQELAAAYRSLVAILAVDGPVDPTRVTEERVRAEEATAVLRALQADLAPHRLLGDNVPEPVRAMWRASAALAAEAATANAALVTRADLRLTAVSARLAEVDAGSRAMNAYRPAGARIPVVADRRA